ncbi:MAG: peptide deformylase [Minisyncoccota bacterium]
MTTKEQKTKQSAILQKDSPVLRGIAKEVPIKDIKSKELKEIISKMKKAVRKEEDGVAIAAPQIGESLRIFVVAGRALAIIDKNKDPEGEKTYPDLVFVNPELTKLSKKKKKMEEGCLSVRWLYGQVERSERVYIKAFDEEGKKVERGAAGLLAQIFQHEVDHLNGVLFIDKATDIEDLPPKNE